MIIAIASGKGGTGKTTIAVNLAAILEESCTLLDCDVEEPNVQLFLKAEITKKEDFTVPIPVINKDLCTHCGKCSQFCRFNALAVLPTEVMVFPELCHNCGGCMLVCPERAITEEPHTLGTIETGKRDNINFIMGTLNIGEAHSEPLIKAVRVKGESENKDNIILIDAPPGTSCPVIASVDNADFCILVTEPTPFGLNDLDLAVKMIRTMQIPCGVVINRTDIGDDSVLRYCDNEEIPILMEILEDRHIAEIYSEGKLIVEALPNYKKDFHNLIEQIKKWNK